MTALIPLRTAQTALALAGMKRAAPLVAYGYKRQRRIGRTARAVITTAKYLKRAGPAASKIGRAYRKYRASKAAARRNIGERIGTSNAQNVSTDSVSANNMVDEQFYWQPILWPQRETAVTDTRNKRNGDIINLRGIKICQDFVTVNTFTTGTKLYLNVAFVTNKHNPQSSSVNNNRWFRSKSTNRGEDFTSLNSGIDYHCRPINTDEWNVLFHRRKVLSAVAATQDGRTFYKCAKYVPIKRQIRFDQDNNASHNFFMVWWCSVAGSAGLPSGNICAKTTWSHTLYFREAKLS